MIKKSLAKLLIFTAIFYACDNNEEEFNEDIDSIQNLTEKNATTVLSENQGFVGDVIGWSWNGESDASYISSDGNITTLFIGSYNGQTFTETKRIVMELDGIISWSWDGTTCSYHRVIGNETFLYVRDFDGTTFGPAKRSFFLSGNNIMLGWSWKENKASYIVREKHDRFHMTLFTRTFDGTTYGSPTRQGFIISDGELTSLSIHGTIGEGSYHWNNPRDVDVVLSSMTLPEFEGGNNISSFNTRVRPDSFHMNNSSEGLGSVTININTQPIVSNVTEYKVFYDLEINKLNPQGEVINILTKSYDSSIFNKLGSLVTPFVLDKEEGSEFTYTLTANVFDLGDNPIGTRSEKRRLFRVVNGEVIYN